MEKNRPAEVTRRFRVRVILLLFQRGEADKFERSIRATVVLPVLVQQYVLIHPNHPTNFDSYIQRAQDLELSV